MRAGVLAAALCQSTLRTVVSPSCDLGTKSDLLPLQGSMASTAPAKLRGREGIQELLALVSSVLALLPLGCA